MKGTHRHYSLAVWAAREIQRQTGRQVLLFACLFSLVFLLAAALLFSQALRTTWTYLMDQAPDIIVRRVDAGGWAPMPADQAVAWAARVPGVLDPTPRLWGVASGPGGPVTVVASRDVIPQAMLAPLTPPAAGQAVVGQAVAGRLTDPFLSLTAVNTLRLEVIGAFPPPTDPATRDVVWVAPADARRLLGLSPHQASDLAVHLARREEEQAIQPDLAAAFPFPVSITDRSTSALGHLTLAARTGGIALVAAIPALLALLLVIASVGVGAGGQRPHWGLLQSLGWSLADLVHLQVAKALIVGVPALCCGLASAVAAVFWPPAARITAFWITGGGQLPALMPRAGDVAVTLLEIAAMIGLPFLAAVFLACLRSVADDPWASMQAEPWN